MTDKTRVVYTETLSNPTLVVADVPALAALAHARVGGRRPGARVGVQLLWRSAALQACVLPFFPQGCKLVVDNTFTPLLLSPIRLGADVVVHSLTKVGARTAAAQVGSSSSSSRMPGLPAVHWNVRPTPPTPAPAAVCERGERHPGRRHLRR